MMKSLLTLLTSVAVMLSIGLISCGEKESSIKADTSVKTEIAKTKDASKTEEAEKTGDTAKIEEAAKSEVSSKEEEENKKGAEETKEEPKKSKGVAKEEVKKKIEKESKNEAKKDAKEKDKKEAKDTKKNIDKIKAKTATKKAEGATAESVLVEVVDLKLAASIKERAPVEPADTFEAGSRAYTWIKLKVNEPETTIKLRYSIDDKIIWTSDPITVKKAPGWRTWMRKKLHKSGSWKVEVLDANDQPVHSTSFTVK